MFQILIVDDDSIMRRALKVMIDKINGFEVCGEAATGSQALAIYEQTNPDIIIMDILMPGLTGLDVAKTIRAKDLDTTIYLLSAYKNFNLAKEAVRLQIKEYLLKPLSMKALSELLNTYKKEKEGSVSHYLNAFEALVENGDFRQLYYGLDEPISKIYKKYSGDDEKLVEVFRYVGQRLIAQSALAEDSKSDLESLFPLNECLISEPMIAQMWLFKVLNYVYEKEAIRRYPVLQNVFTYIDENIRSDISLNQIIESCSISQGYLSRIFKNQFQVSVMEYLHLRKMHLAKGYFYLTNDSVAEVAFRLGYSESNYFSKVFKKYERITVQQYRKSIQTKRGTA